MSAAANITASDANKWNNWDSLGLANPNVKSELNYL